MPVPKAHTALVTAKPLRLPAAVLPDGLAAVFAEQDVGYVRMPSYI